MGPNAERQPVLLTATEENVNAAQALFLLDGAEPPEVLDGYERCVVMFDGRDEAATAAARTRWREVKAAGLSASYWRQSEEGAWGKQG